jgi:aspartate/methionine/tyrosine aminotransferase
MQIAPFEIERFYLRHEFAAEHMLSSSDCESRTVRELLELEPEPLDRLLELRCGYTESPGAPSLREAIAATYSAVDPDDVLVLTCAEEGIFAAYHALLGPGDHVIVETPCYGPALEVARSTRDVYDRALSLGSVSKAHGLPGLRLGWIATRDAAALGRFERCLARRRSLQSDTAAR